MSIPYNFANLLLSGFPTNSLGESYAPASLLDTNFDYLMANVTSDVYSFIASNTVTFGSFNIFEISSEASAYLPVANSNSGNPAVVMITNSSSSTLSLLVAPNRNTTNVILGVTTIPAGTTVLYISDGANTFYSMGSTLTNPVPIIEGGTGATTLAQAQSNLEIPSIPVPISEGGTGATTLAAAQTSLAIPSLPVSVSNGGTGANSVGGAVSNLGLSKGLLANGNNTYTTSTTLTNANMGQIVYYTGAAAATFTLPNASTCAAQSIITIYNNSSYSLALAPYSGQTVSVIGNIFPNDSVTLATDGVSIWRAISYGANYSYCRQNYGQIFRNTYTYTTSTSLTAANLGSFNKYFNSTANGTFTLPPSSSFGSTQGASLIIQAVTTYSLTLAVVSGDNIAPAVTNPMTGNKTTYLVWQGGFWEPVFNAIQW